MKKIAGIMSILLALSLLLLPAQVFAATSSLAQDCKYDTVKWEDNPDSCKLYLDNWGNTPMTAMSRQAGLLLPVNRNIVNTACFGNCACCNDETGNLGCCTDPDACQDAEECPAVAICGLPPYQERGCNAEAVYGYAHCCCYWGMSLAFANKSWAGKDLGDKPQISNDHPMYRGTSERRNPAHGGDWGITGCAHSECAADIWCLACNMDKNSACRMK